MTSHREHVRRDRPGWGGLLLATLLAGCTHVPFDPAPVVPTKHRLPQSARLSLLDIGAYTVEAGATMSPEPHLHNRVTGQVASLTADRRRWEQAVADYVSARQTFRSVQTDGKADLTVSLRVIIYIDPSLGFKFNTVYVVRADAQVQEAASGQVVGDFSGFGKAAGVVRRTGPRDDEGPVNAAMHAALNDLFGALESDRRVTGLRTTGTPR